MEFSSNPHTKCTKTPQCSISVHPFSDVSSQKYLNSQVRTNKSGYAVFFTTLVLQDQPQGYILSYFFKLLRVLHLQRMFLRVLYLQRMLVEFFLTCIFQHVWEKIFNLQCSHSWKLHSIYAFICLPHSPTQNSQQKFLNICFLQYRRGGRTYDLLHNTKIQSENMKMTWSITWHGFTVL